MLVCYCFAFPAAIIFAKQRGSSKTLCEIWTSLQQIQQMSSPPDIIIIVNHDVEPQRERDNIKRASMLLVCVYKIHINLLS